MLANRNSAFFNSLFDLYSKALAVFSKETDRGAASIRLILILRANLSIFDIMRKPAFLLLGLAILAAGCHPTPHYSTIIRHATLYDGSGNSPQKADIAINADTIAAIGDLSGARADTTIDAQGKAVSPGFIDMQSQSMETLIQDGRSLGAISQGVTLEIFGEGESMGPLTDTMKKIAERNQGDIRFPIRWTSLKDYLQYLQHKGVSTNVASFVGASTIRENLLGYSDRAPDSAELQQMKALVQKAMEEGALGIGSALIYAPGFY